MNPFPTPQPTPPSSLSEFFDLCRAAENVEELKFSDVADFGVQVVQNILKNSSRLKRAKRAIDLEGKFRGTPAVICGAGPSLQKNSSLLPELKERALLFAGGSSLHALSKVSILPHFAAALDPAPPRHLFADSAMFEVPFLYLQRVCPYLLSLVHGPLLSVPENGSYPLEGWLAGTDRTLDGGWNVATLCMAVAHLLGCTPIILVGMDLSHPSEMLGEERLVPTVDTEGRGVFARPDWLAAKGWIEEFGKGAHVINATEGGIGFAGIENVPLSEIALGEKRDLEGEVYASLEMLSSIEPANRLEQLEESLARTGSMCDALLADIRDYFPEKIFEKGEYILKEVELEEELAAQKILIPIWQAWSDRFLEADGLTKLLFFKRVIDELKRA